MVLRKHAAGARQMVPRGYIKWTESGVAGVLTVETRDGAVCDAGYGTRPGLDIAALPHGLARFVN